MVQYLPCCCVELHITILSDPCSTQAFVYLPHTGWCTEWKYQNKTREFASCILNVPSSSLGCCYNNGRLAWYYFFLVFGWHHVAAELRSLMDALSIPWVRDEWILNIGGIIVGSWNRNVRRSTCPNVSFFPCKYPTCPALGLNPGFRGEKLEKTARVLSLLMLSFYTLSFV